MKFSLLALNMLFFLDSKRNNDDDDDDDIDNTDYIGDCKRKQRTWNRFAHHLTSDYDNHQH